MRDNQLYICVVVGHFPARALPSAGLLPWLKSLLCDSQNICFNQQVPSEVAGQINQPVNTTDLNK